MHPSRYVIGIDLGTTNSALAYADTSEAEPALQMLAIPQVVQQGVIEERPLSPSFLYLPKGNELPAGSLKLPWDAKRTYAVGEFARDFGSQVPTRLVSSAKSWLCHPGIDRRAPVLPWKAPEDAEHISPLEASARYLKHLAEAWNHVVAKNAKDARLEQQDIVLTVPASFDAVARELTVEAARNAGLEHVTLLEEPQAAFYSWIEQSREQWRKQVEVGDVVLVCDVGGGTTDFSLIAVDEEDGQLALSRLAVGDHILLGGDNMDLALAHHVAGKFAEKGTKLDAGQMLVLWHACRSAKEKLLGDPKLKSQPVTILGRGSKVVGGTLKMELGRDDVERVIVEGFFPESDLAAEPRRQSGLGFQELGLPYAADPAITKHLAEFLRRHQEVIGDRAPKKKGSKGPRLPTGVLYNGGVFRARILEQRLTGVLNSWLATAGGGPIKVLENRDVDLAVARGGAYYGLARRGRGVRIRGGTARAYYVAVETSQPAVPGLPPPLKALCVAPFGMEEGTEADVPGQEFGLVVGEPAQFMLMASSVRRGDVIGTLVEEWQGEIEKVSPVETVLESAGKEGRTTPVRLHSKVTPVGTLELWCHGREAKQRWKLEFEVRQRGT